MNWNPFKLPDTAENRAFLVDLRADASVLRINPYVCWR